MRVVGTAGHVDHGKTSLILSLTGIQTDRLKEEQDRQMTIDLGFAWTTLPNGEEVGFVDVPGHQDFIENMLSGIGGIDAAVLVIAADEGVMPQTREHMAILDLLEVRHGLVALTKIDLVEDQSWLNLVIEEIENLLRNTTLEGTEICGLSSPTGDGLEEFTLALQNLIAGIEKNNVDLPPRLPIDRVFTLSGFGTIVTGTLLDGSFSVGDAVRILPSGLRSRIRGLQTHQVAMETAVAGSRAAANLTGIEVGDLTRGDVLTKEDSYQPTSVMECSFLISNDYVKTLKHNQEVKVFIGTAQRIGRVHILDKKEIFPDESGWIRIHLDNAVVARRGDHYILRRPSPPATIGGGMVADAFPEFLRRRDENKRTESLARLLSLDANLVLLEFVELHGPVRLDSIDTKVGVSEGKVQGLVSELVKSNQIIQIAASHEADLLLTETQYEEIWQEVHNIMASYHQKYPLRFGMGGEELNGKLSLWNEDLLRPILELFVEHNRMTRKNSRFLLEEFAPKLTREENETIDRVISAMENSPYSPPTKSELGAMADQELMLYLLETARLRQISEEILLTEESFQEMLAAILDELESNGSITVAQVRDKFRTSRKYALPLLEYLDGEGITRREGDLRRLGTGAG